MTKAALKAAGNPPALIEEMANRSGLDPDEFKATIVATCMGTIKRPPTDEEFAALLMVAREYKLNPLLKEIHAFPSRSGGIVPVVGIDGWIALINNHPAFTGIEFEMTDDKQGNPVRCLCRIHRKDRDLPTVVEEYFKECFRPTEPWKAMPHRMLRHKALIQCARIAFGFSGIYDEDDAVTFADERIIVPAGTAAEPETRPKLIDVTAEAATDAPEQAENDEVPAEGDSGVTQRVDENPVDDTEKDANRDEALPSEGEPAEIAEDDPENFVVEMKFGEETGVPREKEFTMAMIQMIESCSSGEQLDMAWEVNLDDIKQIGAHWRKKIMEAGAARRAEVK